MSNLTLRMRDPTEADLVEQQFWWNSETKQLFMYNGKWIALNQPERSKREDQKIFHGKHCTKCTAPISYYYETDSYECSGCGTLNFMET